MTHTSEGRWIECEDCAGTGRTYDISARGCDSCDGLGRWWDDASDTGFDPISDLKLREALRLDAQDAAGFTECLSDPLRRVA